MNATAQILESAFVDRTRFFLCESVTPLFYTPSYASLAEEQRLAYNQYTGMYCNEAIRFFEATFLRTLEKLRDDPSLDLRPDLREELTRFAAEEAEHVDMFLALNRKSAPEWYGVRENVFLSVPSWQRRGLEWTAARPRSFLLVLWVLLLQEERFLDLSRRSLRPVRHPIEKNYATTYRLHMQEEARHVAIDRKLIDFFYRPAPRWVREWNAAILRPMLRHCFLIPGRSIGTIMRQLATTFPELAPRLPQMLRELAALAKDPRYHAMMYSRVSVPNSFALFDSLPEMARMQGALLAYDRRIQGVGG